MGSSAGQNAPFHSPAITSPMVSLSGTLCRWSWPTQHSTDPTQCTVHSPQDLQKASADQPGPGHCTSIDLSSNSRHRLMEKMVSGPERAKGDGKGLSKADGNQKPRGACLKPRSVHLQRAPSPYTCQAPVHYPSMDIWGYLWWQTWWLQWIHPHCVKLPSCQTSPLLC